MNENRETWYRHRVQEALDRITSQTSRAVRDAGVHPMLPNLMGEMEKYVARVESDLEYIRQLIWKYESGSITWDCAECLKAEDISVVETPVSNAKGERTYRVQLTHKPTGLSATCENFLSAHKNKSEAMKMLRLKLEAKKGR